MFFWMVVALILAVAIVATPAGKIAYIKLQMYAEGAKFMAKAKDLPSKYQGSNLIKMNKQSGSHEGGRRKIRIVFIRHGQSVWNSLFNSFGTGWPARMVKAVVRETVDFFTNPFESAIIDSPLSAKGKKEAQELAAFFRAAKGKISTSPTSSVVVASNLRRAMETALVGVSPRLTITQERIVVDSSLQEGSQNIDAQTLSTQRHKLAPMLIGSLTDAKQLPSVFDPCLNEGGKVIGVDVFKRMDTFLVHLFGGSTDSLVPAHGGDNADLKEIIVVGHSGYFRNFFRRFLPASSTHVGKQKKMQNCAVVAFDLYRNDSTGEISIDESSVTVLYKGFK